MWERLKKLLNTEWWRDVSTIEKCEILRNCEKGWMDFDLMMHLVRDDYLEKPKPVKPFKKCKKGQIVFNVPKRYLKEEQL
jgi:hypothetical protein